MKLKDLLRGLNAKWTDRAINHTFDNKPQELIIKEIYSDINNIIKLCDERNRY